MERPSGTIPEANSIAPVHAQVNGLTVKSASHEVDISKGADDTWRGPRATGGSGEGTELVSCVMGRWGLRFS